MSNKAAQKPTLRQRVFNLDTLRSLFTGASFCLDVVDVAAIMYAGVESITIGWLQNRARGHLPLIRYTWFVKINYYSWWVITGCWIGSLVLGAATRTLDKYMQTRARTRELCPPPHINLA